MTANPAPFVLASVLASYPAGDSVAGVPELAADCGETLPAALRSLIETRFAPGNLADTQSGYISLFDSGPGAEPIHETSFDRRRAMSKGGELADIAGFYRAFGFELDPGDGAREMADHVGIELEFYALMLMKEIHLAEAGNGEGAAIAADAAAKFLKAHLGRVPAAIAARPGVAADPFYGPVFAWCATVVADECARRDVVCVPAEWLGAPDGLDERPECAAAGGPEPGPGSPCS